MMYAMEINLAFRILLGIFVFLMKAGEVSKP